MLHTFGLGTSEMLCIMLKLQGYYHHATYIYILNAALYTTMLHIHLLGLVLSTVLHTLTRFGVVSVKYSITHTYWFGVVSVKYSITHTYSVWCC